MASAYSSMASSIGLLFKRDLKGSRRCLWQIQAAALGSDSPARLRCHAASSQGLERKVPSAAPRKKA